MSAETGYPVDFEPKRRLVGISSGMSITIDGEVGRGGQGIVSKGRLGVVGEVAVKELHVQNIDNERLESAREAFAREGEVHKKASNLSAGIVGFGYVDSDMRTSDPFMVMQLMRGSVRVQRGGFSPEVALHVTGQVADALAGIHKFGIVHRDIKPANIMVGTDGSSIGIGDFGLAVDLGDKTVFDGIPQGTLPYMSLQALQGAAPVPGHDIHALGVASYQLLTGRLPYYHDDKDKRIKYRAYVHDVASGDIPALPSVTSNPIYDRELSIVIGNMLDRDPDRLLPAEDLALIFPQLAEDIARAKTQTDIPIGNGRSRMQAPATSRKLSRTSLSTAKIHDVFSEIAQ